MSFVYHGNYVKFFEMGRIAWLKKIGVSYRKMEENGIINPVIDLKVNFRKSIFNKYLTIRDWNLKLIPFITGDVNLIFNINQIIKMK